MSKLKDCLKVAKEVEIDSHYDLAMSDARKLYEAYGHDPAQLIFQSFALGYAQGQKAQRAAERGNVNAAY